MKWIIIHKDERTGEIITDIITADLLSEALNQWSEIRPVLSKHILSITRSN
jgi:hypothetical protein